MRDAARERGAGRRRPPSGHHSKKKDNSPHTHSPRCRRRRPGKRQTSRRHQARPQRMRMCSPACAKPSAAPAATPSPQFSSFPCSNATSIACSVTLAYPPLHSAQKLLARSRCPWGNILLVEEALTDSKDKRRKAVMCDMCQGLPYALCTYNCSQGAAQRGDPRELFPEVFRAIKLG